MNKWFFLVIFLWVAGCSEPTWMDHRTSGSALGTSYSIVYLSKDESNFQSEIDSVFEVVNQSMSTYREDSDISKINSGSRAIVVDAMFRDVFLLSKEVHQKTKGYFDPTVGILVNAWGFGPGRSMEMDSGTVDSLLRYVGFDKVRLTPENRIEKESPHLYLDFNAIAKGYAIDRLALLLDHKGISDYLVEVGGEVVAKGENRIKQKPWSVGIEDPQEEESRTLKHVIQLKNKALASSGNYRKFLIDPHSGKKYVHTIDPITGYTKNSNILAASVVANTCAKADAYATAFMAMDLEDSIALLQQQNELEAYIVYLDASGSVQEFMTTGFKSLVIS